MLINLLRYLTPVFLFLILLIYPKQTYAIENFDAVYNVVYRIQDDTNTRATIDVALTNTSDRYFASSYSLQIGFSEIENVKASDPEGQLAPKITKNSSGQKIDLEFNSKIVGKGKTLNFTLTFDTPNVAKKQGKIWEINVPGIASPDEFKDFNVELIPPVFLEKPLYIKPAHATNNLKFTKKDLGKSGISVTFGEKQIYDYNIKYHLQNDNIFPIKRQIALPPTTNYQDVFISSILPKPENVIIDPDGNWMAEYTLSPTERLDIAVTGKVEVSIQPKKEPLANSSRSKYLEDKKYWEVSNPEIQKIARELKTPENIYKYVVNELKYDFSRVNTNQKRLGALRVLSEKDKAVCLEFTDLFITLARAAGIPSREINGFAFTENTQQRPISLLEDILHAWPEYYDDKDQTWKMIDPTWGNTTGGTDYFNVFDLDHIVFVRKGIESTSPLPAGAYKIKEDKNKKDLSISFATIPGNDTPSFKLKNEFKNSYSSQLPINGVVEISNSGSSLIQNQTIKITSSNLSPSTQIAKLQPIPPFGKQNINVKFDGPPLLTNSNYNFKIELLDYSIDVNFRVSPFNLTIDRLIFFIYVIIAAIIIWAATQGAWRLLIPQRNK